MDIRYKQLFTLLSQSIANLAEEVMNIHEKNNEEKEQHTAQIMRDDFLDVHDKLTNDEQLTKSDFARLLVGAIIITNQLDSRIKNEQKALEGYKVDIIPKLDQINNAETAEAALELAEQLFAESVIDEKEESTNN